MHALEAWGPPTTFKTVPRIEEAFGSEMEVGDVTAMEDFAKAKAIISRYLGKP